MALIQEIGDSDSFLTRNKDTAGSGNDDLSGHTLFR